MINLIISRHLHQYKLLFYFHPVIKYNNWSKRKKFYSSSASHYQKPKYGSHVHKLTELNEFEKEEEDND